MNVFWQTLICKSQANYIIFLKLYMFSDDPVISAAVDDASQQRHSHEAEDVDTDVGPNLCGCNACPDLTEEEFSKCCQNVKKAREKCSKETISCICESQKLSKLLDKARLIIAFEFVLKD